MAVAVFGILPEQVVHKKGFSGTRAADDDFIPVAVRKGAKYHGLNTDASFRFERGVDPNNTRTAISQAISMIQEIAGGTLVSEIIDVILQIINSLNHYIDFIAANLVFCGADSG